MLRHLINNPNSSVLYPELGEHCSFIIQDAAAIDVPAFAQRFSHHSTSAQRATPLPPAFLAPRRGTRSRDFASGPQLEIDLLLLGFAFLTLVIAFLGLPGEPVAKTLAHQEMNLSTNEPVAAVNIQFITPQAVKLLGGALSETLTSSGSGAVDQCCNIQKAGIERDQPSRDSLVEIFKPKKEWVPVVARQILLAGLSPLQDELPENILQRRAEDVLDAVGTLCSVVQRTS